MEKLIFILVIALVAIAITLLFRKKRVNTQYNNGGGSGVESPKEKPTGEEPI